VTGRLRVSLEATDDLSRRISGPSTRPVARFAGSAWLPATATPGQAMPHPGDTWYRTVLIDIIALSGRGVQEKRAPTRRSALILWP
jgi:hypothetical protein